MTTTSSSFIFERPRSYIESYNPQDVKEKYMLETAQMNGDTHNDAQQQLHWTQRIALVRHNLHSARRTNDFTFFKSLQAHALLEGTDHVALLQSSLGDQADTVLSTLDNLNAGIAYVHQGMYFRFTSRISGSNYTD